MEMDIKRREEAARVGRIVFRQETETGRGIREVCIYREENE